MSNKSNEEPKRYKIGEIAELLCISTYSQPTSEGGYVDEGYYAAALRRWQQAGLIVPKASEGSGRTSANKFEADQVYRARLLVALLQFDFSIKQLKEFMSYLDEPRTAVPSKRPTKDSIPAALNDVLKLCLAQFGKGEPENCKWIVQIHSVRPSTEDSKAMGLKKSEVQYGGKLYRGLEDIQRLSWEPNEGQWKSDIEALVIVHLASIWLPLFEIMPSEAS